MATETGHIHVGLIRRMSEGNIKIQVARKIIYVHVSHAKRRNKGNVSINSSLHLRALNFCNLVWSKVGLDTLK